MTNDESYEKCMKDLLNLVDEWKEEGVVSYEGIYAGLTLFMNFALQSAPSKEALFGMITQSMLTADESYKKMKGEAK